MNRPISPIRAKLQDCSDLTLVQIRERIEDTWATLCHQMGLTQPPGFEDLRSSKHMDVTEWS